MLEAARRLGKELARIRVGEDEPTPEQFHVAVRDVISHCIHGVDQNPLAVDLCKLALWLEGHWAGKPLSFLDHRIRCGNSSTGIVSPSIMEEGIPDDAFDPISGDDKKVAISYKRRNKSERALGQKRLEFRPESSGTQRGVCRAFWHPALFPGGQTIGCEEKSRAFRESSWRR